jgi:hypothetical protein
VLSCVFSCFLLLYCLVLSCQDYGECNGLGVGVRVRVRVRLGLGLGLGLVRVRVG